MLRSLEGLQFVKSHADGLEIQMGAQSKMIEMAFDLQAFQREEGLESRAYMIILGHNPVHRRFAQGSVLLERLVEDCYRPSCLIGR